MLRDAAGNSFKGAKGLNLGSTNINLKDRVGGGLSNFYRFNLVNRSSFNLDFKGAGKADITLIQDRNGNGRGDRDEILARISAKTNSLSKTSDELAPGTYFLRVTPALKGATRYSMTLAASPLTALSQKPDVSSGGATVPSTSTPGSDFVVQVLNLTNSFRQQNGLQPLSYSDRLSVAAQTYSQSMATQDFFAHAGLDGSTPQIRGTSAGYEGGIGENIAAGYATPNDVVQAWINSPGHRANLLNPSYRDLGIGYYNLPNDPGNLNYQYYWTQDFGIPS